jgi:DNA-binding transcriptional ArsR family regulator
MTQESLHPLLPVFRALSDPTRLTLFEHLIGMGEQRVGELAALFELSTPTISRHLKVLREAGLIESEVDRQWRICRARPNMLRELEMWLDQKRWFWSEALENSVLMK